MNTYKITNITNKVGKRDPKFNTIANIEYIDNRTKKIKGLKPGETFFLSVQSLPLSVHRLRIKKLIEITEVSPSELKKPTEKPKPKKVTKKAAPKAKKVVATVTEEKVEASKEVSSKKTPSRKKTEEE